MKTFPTDKEAREEIIEIGRRMYERGYVASNDGNISVKVSDHEIWATPTGVSKGFMTEDMLVKLDLDGHVLKGTHKPSSEIRMHLCVYRECPDIGGVTHAHPLFGTAFACAGLPLEGRILPEGVVQLGVVPCAQTAIPGTEEVPESIVPYLHDYNAVLLGNHGVLTWGDTAMQSYMRLESTEFYAQILLIDRYIIKKEQTFSDEQLDQLIAIREKLGIHRGGRPG